VALPTYTTTYDAVEAMQSAFDAYWSAQPVRSVVVYDNVGLDPVQYAVPIISDDSEVQGEAVLVMQVLHSTGQIAALGTLLHRQFGFMVGALYVESGRGRVRTVGKLGDAVLKFFQTVNVAGVTFSNPRLNEVGPDGRWWQINIATDFQYDIVRS
jgi:hypothetical protein